MIDDSKQDKKYSAVVKLADKIVEYSCLCIESLSQTDGIVSKEKFQANYGEAMHAYMYFFLHITDRIAFKLLGQEKRDKLQNILVPLSYVIITSGFPEDLKDAFKDARNNLADDFSQGYANAHKEYATCKLVFVKPGEDGDNAFEKMISGQKSKALINRLRDNLSGILTGNIMAGGFGFNLIVIRSVTELLHIHKKEIEKLILDTSEEIEPLTKDLEE